GTEAVPAGPRVALRDLQLLSASVAVGIGARQAPLRGRAGAGAPSVWILRHRLRDYAGTRAPVAQRTGAGYSGAGLAGGEAIGGQAADRRAPALLASALLRFQCLDEAQADRETALHAS